MPLSSGVPSSTIRTGLVLAGMLRLTGLGFQAACEAGSSQAMQLERSVDWCRWGY